MKAAATVLETAFGCLLAAISTKAFPDNAVNAEVVLAIVSMAHHCARSERCTVTCFRLHDQEEEKNGAEASCVAGNSVFSFHRPNHSIRCSSRRCLRALGDGSAVHLFSPWTTRRGNQE